VNGEESLVKRSTILLLTIVSLATGCRSLEQGTGAAMLVGTSWRAEEIDGRAVLDRVPSTLAFDDDSHVSGSTACNGYSGSAQRAGNTLHFQQMVTTRRACTPAVMDQEKRFLDALNAATSLSVRGSALSLLDSGGRTLVRFTKMDATAKSGSSAERTVFTASGPEAPLTVYVFECGTSFSFVMKTIGADAVDVTVPEGTRRLARERTASGAKYSDGKVAVWNKGHEASLDLFGTAHECEENHPLSIREDARARGVEFRGAGNEPGWVLELLRDRIVFTGDYGKSRAALPRPNAQVETTSGGTLYTAVSSSNRLTVRIQRRECMDPMSGERFEAQVEVQLNARTYRGCGYKL